MEIKDLHVAIVFSPICGPNTQSILLSRSVSIKFGFELWAEGGNMEEFLENLHKVTVTIIINIIIHYQHHHRY